MSTKKIEQALERLFATAKIGSGDLELVDAANAELEAIREVPGNFTKVNDLLLTIAKEGDE